MANLLLIKSSAGSGKTHTLVDTYLCMLFKGHKQKFAEILGVTFTNKAAEEMKTRIIEALDDIIKNANNTKYLKNCGINLSNKQIQEKAKDIQKRILHDYTQLAISTIDSFVQRIVRSFAFEFRLPITFNIQLDEDYVKTILYEMLMEKMLDDPELEKWITGLLMYKLEENKPWRIESDIKDIASYLFKEEFWQIIEKVGLDKFKRENLYLLKQRIDDIISRYLDTVNEFKKEIEPLFSPIAAILGNKRNRKKIFKILKFFTEFSENTTPESFDDTICQFLKSPQSIKLDGVEQEVIDFYLANTDKLQGLLLDLKDFVEDNYPNYITAIAIKQNFYTLGLFVDMVNLLKEYRNRYNEFLIIDLTVFLRKFIGEDDAPFIYEKIGQRFKNIFIDEFQDTSRFQWDNFKPLISNSLANGEDSLLVGDVKQAIYRWRNGDWKILLYEVEKDFKSYVQNTKLDVNYRSFYNIVAFNNLIFKTIAESSKNFEEIKDAYSDVNQKIADQNKNYFGRVEVHLFKVKGNSKIAKLQASIKKLSQTIVELRQQGYKYSDIAILVRTNSQITDFVNGLILAQQTQELENFPIISNDALFVKNSPAVKTIIALLKFFNYQDESRIFYLYEAIINLNRFRNQTVNIADLMLNKKEDALLKFFPEQFISNWDKLEKLQLFDKIQLIIRTLDLNKNKQQLAYLRTFENFVLDFIYTYGADLKIFLELWEEKGDNLAIDMSGEHDAITIMTIHKAKGLAFPVVIMPFVDWQINNNNTIIWAKPDSQDFNILPVYPIKNKIAYKGSFFKQDLEKEEIYSLMDAINLLYVGFTRSKQQLIIYSFPSKSNNTSLSNIKSLFINALKSQENKFKYIQGRSITLDENNDIEYDSYILDENFEGKKVELDKDKDNFKTLPIQDYIVNNWADKIKITYKHKEFFKQTNKTLNQSIEYGDLMHKIMSQVKTFDQIPSVVKEFYNNGLLFNYKPENIIETLQNMVEQAGVKDWFSDKWNVRNEVDIILPRKAKELRPDRVIFNEQKLIIIDFKFAQPSNEHIKQVKEYIKLYEKMPDYKDKIIEGYLLYQDGTLKKV